MGATVQEKNKTTIPASVRRRFIKFIILILVGFGTGFYFSRHGVKLTPESFQAFVLSMGVWGPVLYIGVFVIRPLFLIPSIALFIAGGLAFGPVVGPLYASVGAGAGGTLGFWIARTMGHDYVKSKLKLGADMIDDTRFSFSMVWLLSLIPIMPVTVINYGAGLSTMRFRHYILAHVLGLTPRAYAYGFFGSTLLAIGSTQFRVALIILIVLALISLYMRYRARRKRVLELEAAQ
ncbi:TVP38/TMEM64 family protein [Nitrospina gracilis]|uniref:TVP38/TMEM64 family protein n=1 Tax=Nitrospina gracilis TaxID=35801 RepID=UPI001F453EEA|nr:TVP38/TMEM64 family protein [Nitrospina gracilis]MCF8720765.1 putative membrane protein YdjX (TVP38/TMEM64 family) [Nitrospina gracilis Nb-211]